MARNWDDMKEAEQDPYWAKFKEGGYHLEEEDSVVAEEEGPLVGVLTGIRRNVGENDDSTIYTVRTEDLDRPVKFWGSAHIDNQVKGAPIEVGTVMGVKKTGETQPTEKGEMQLFEVRYSND